MEVGVGVGYDKVWSIKLLERKFSYWLGYIFNVSSYADPLTLLHGEPCITSLLYYVSWKLHHPSQSRWKIFSFMFSMQILRLKIEHFSTEYRKSVKTNL